MPSQKLDLPNFSWKKQEHFTFMEKIPLTDQEYQFVHQIVQSMPPGSRSVRVAHGQIIRQNGQLRRFGGWKNHFA